MSGILNRHHLHLSPLICVHQLAPTSLLIDQSGKQRMRKLKILSTINSRPLKCVSVYQLLRSEINQQSTDDNVGRDASVVNQPIPLQIKDDKSASGRNGVSVSDSEVLAVLVVLGECQTCLARNWRSGCKRADLIRAILAILYQVLCNLYRVWELRGWEKSTKNRKKPTASFSISICSTPNHNNSKPLRTDTFKVMGNTPIAVVI